MQSLGAALTPEELAALLPIVTNLQGTAAARQDPWLVWSEWGRHVIQTAAAPGGRWNTHETQCLLVQAAIAAEVRPATIEQQLGITTLPRRLFKSSHARRPRRRSGGNGRLGWRKIPVAHVRAVLENASSERCRLVWDRSSLPQPGIASASSSSVASRPEIVQRSVQGSFAQVWRSQEHSLADVVSLSTMYRYRARDHRHIVRPRCKLDVCSKCNIWDRSISRAIESDIRGWLLQLSGLSAGLRVPPLPTVAPASAFIEALRGHIDALSIAAREAHAAGSMTGLQQLQLHDAVSAVRHALRTQWRDSFSNHSLVTVLSGYESHFGQRDAFKEFHRRSWHDPAADTLYVHADFAEHHSLPIGPIVTGEAWYAESLLGVTVFGALAWTRDRRSHRFYLSEVKEQSALFAQACMADCLYDMGVAKRWIRELVVFLDAGPHFVAARFLAYVCRSQSRE